MDSYDYLLKVIVVGPGGVGKTSVTQRYLKGRWMSSLKFTIGVDFSLKTVTVGNHRVKLQIWDTGGQEKFTAVRPVYYKGAVGAMIVFDLTNRKTFEDMDKWVREVETHCGHIPTMLVGNKSDLTDMRQVTTEEAEDYAKEKGISRHAILPFMASSAKDGQNVDAVFSKLSEMMILTVDG